jgi:thymidine kinase
MFTEKTQEHLSNYGSIEAITGSMFSGKTEELMRRIKRAVLANQRVKIFKPIIDKRYSENKIVSHNDNSFISIPVGNSNEIQNFSDGADVIAIDEAQFFDNGLTEICEQLANCGHRIIVAGLDMDYSGNGFGPMPQILAKAEYVTKLQAICQCCGNLAYISFRKTSDKNVIMLGEKNEYEPLCRRCYNLLKQIENGPI